MELTKAQELLKKQVGKPYIFGYEVKLDDPNPPAFDCSELVEWFFHQLGYVMPDGSYNQYPVTTPVILPWPFDLFFMKKKNTIHHVGIVLDSERVVHAKGMTYGVVMDRIEVVSKYDGFDGWRRPKCLNGVNIYGK